MRKVIPFPEALEADRGEITVCVPLARLGLHALSGPLQGREFWVDGGGLVIGRATSCTIVIPSDGVSRRHARIEFHNGAYWLMPEQTVNGTWVNGTLVHDRYELADGDRIGIYDSTFVVARQTLPSPGAELVAPPMPSYPSSPPPPDDWPSRPSAQTVPATNAARASWPGAPPGMYPTGSAAAAPAPAGRRWAVWMVAGVSLVAVVVGVAVVTVRLTAPTATPPPAPAAPSAAPAAPSAAPAAPSAAPAAPSAAPAAPSAAAAPAPSPPVATVPSPPPAPPPRGVLSIETTRVSAAGRGAIVDVVEVGTVVERGAPIGHYRESSAAYNRARAKLQSLERKYGSSPEHEDFIAEARRDLRTARDRRKLHPMIATVRGTVTRLAVKPGDELRKRKVVAELAVARLTVPDAAVDGTGKRCTAALAGKEVKGVLLAIGMSERTLELDRVPTGMAPGDVGAVRLHCPAE